MIKSRYTPEVADRVPSNRCLALDSDQPKNQVTRKAIVLISGGLDSAIAAVLVKSWGIEVVGLHLKSPFGCTQDAAKVAEDLDIPLVVKEKGEAFIKLIERPKYGYGSQMNPCIDCRIYMFELAEKVRLEEKADFIATGEVVGQRPLSQNKSAMKLIERKSPLEERVLRPLSGGNLPPTLPEQMGWIKRENLLKLSGRGRSEQLALAKKLGISHYSSPGGGCLLTEKAFSDRLKDFYEHPSYQNSEEKMAQAALLRLGRHFRISKEVKVIIARTEMENTEFNKAWNHAGCTLFRPANFKGPLGLAFGTLNPESKQTIANLMARYGRKSEASIQKIESLGYCEESTSKSELWDVLEPTHDSVLEKWRIGIT